MGFFKCAHTPGIARAEAGISLLLLGLPGTLTSGFGFDRFEWSTPRGKEVNVLGVRLVKE
jgi:hypothetical protein